MTVVRLKKVTSLLGRLSDAVNSYISYRMRHAVPECELRRAKREISRYRRQMRHAH